MFNIPIFNRHNYGLVNLKEKFGLFSLGFSYKGIPLPTPPQEVMDLSSKATEHVYLVLFFDAKRTWQWLPAEKLELMGVDTEKDEEKVCFFKLRQYKLFFPPFLTVQSISKANISIILPKNVLV